MKALKRIVLINWHYFTFETLELDTINFLTGKNGAGKTTVIDAIQLLMLGDTTGHFFNKSATDKSSRTLNGYLRCEIGDDDDGNPIYKRKLHSFLEIYIFYSVLYPIGKSMGLSVRDLWI